MKFGKFEISEFCIGAVVCCVVLYIILHFTLAEESLKERTKQLELEKEIIELKVLEDKER